MLVLTVEDAEIDIWIHWISNHYFLTYLSIHFCIHLIFFRTGRRSHCYRVIYRHMERTLTQEEVRLVHQQIEQTAEAELGVQGRYWESQTIIWPFSIRALPWFSTSHYLTTLSLNKKRTTSIDFINDKDAKNTQFLLFFKSFTLNRSKQVYFTPEWNSIIPKPSEKLRHRAQLYHQVKKTNITK